MQPEPNSRRKICMFGSPCCKNITSVIKLHQANLFPACQGWQPAIARGKLRVQSAIGRKGSQLTPAFRNGFFLASGLLNTNIIFALQASNWATLPHSEEVYAATFDLLGRVLSTSGIGWMYLWRPNFVGQWQCVRRITADGELAGNGEDDESSPSQMD